MCNDCGKKRREMAGRPLSDTREVGKPVPAPKAAPVANITVTPAEGQPDLSCCARKALAAADVLKDARTDGTVLPKTYDVEYIELALRDLAQYL